MTDKFDRFLINSVIKDYFNKSIFDSDFKIRGLYEIPQLDSLNDWIDHCLNLNENLEVPELFGIHKNGDITSAKLQTNQLVNDALVTIPRGGSGEGGKSEDDVLLGLCDY